MGVVSLGTPTRAVSGDDPRLAVLRCPDCSRVGLGLNSGRLQCPSCGADRGHADDPPDLAPHLPQAPSTATEPGERWVPAHVRQRLVQAWTGLSYGEEAGWIRRHCVPASGPVLELASGHGREARVLASAFGTRRVIALDIRRDMLRNSLAAGRGLDILHLRGDATRLPFGDATLGAVDCFGALHLIPDVRAVVAEVGRVLQPGGSFSGQALMFGSKLLQSKAAAPLVRRALSPLARPIAAADFETWCSEAGLESLSLQFRRGMAFWSAKKA